MSDALFLELGKGRGSWSSLYGDEWQPELRGQRGAKIYREMADTDPIVGAILLAIRNLCLSVSWFVMSSSQDRRAVEQARFVESCLEDMSLPWKAVVSDILSFLIYGWAFCEVVYKRRGGASDDPALRSRYDDGRIGWRKIALRDQLTLLRWELDESGGLRAFHQLLPEGGTAVIPIEKGLLFRTENRGGSPEGRSILRNAYRPWYFKRHLEVIEAMGIERDLAGLPVVWVPESVLRGDTEQDVALRSAFQSLVSGLRRDAQEGVVMPLAYDLNGRELYRLELLTTGGRRQFELSSTIERYDTRIAQSILADFLMLGTQRVGSYALSVDKTRLFTLAISAYLDEVASVMNTYAIPRLIALNGWDTAYCPELRHDEVETVDLKELGDFLQSLSSAGAPIFPNDDLTRYLLELANLPAPPHPSAEERAD